MEDMTKASDLTQAMATIKVQSERLAEALQKLSKWDISVSVEVVLGSYDLKITIQKPNGSGIIKTISNKEVLYFTEDFNSLVDIVVDNVIDRLFKDEIKKVLYEPMHTGFKNVVKLTGSVGYY